MAVTSKSAQPSLQLHWIQGSTVPSSFGRALGCCGGVVRRSCGATVMYLQLALCCGVLSINCCPEPQTAPCTLLTPLQWQGIWCVGLRGPQLTIVARPYASAISAAFYQVARALTRDPIASSHPCMTRRGDWSGGRGEGAGIAPDFDLEPTAACADGTD